MVPHTIDVNLFNLTFPVLGRAIPAGETEPQRPPVGERIVFILKATPSATHSVIVGGVTSLTCTGSRRACFSRFYTQT